MPRTREQYNARLNELRTAKYYRRQAESIAKLGGKCVDCGRLDSLEFDHVDPATKVSKVTDLLRCGSQDRLNAELAKCVLRCRDCHKSRSDTDQTGEHGEGITGRKGCMCELCGPVKRAYWRKRHAERAKAA